MITKILKNPVLVGSMVMVIGSNIYNGGQFVFHFLSGRFLGTTLYGDFASIISILGLIGIVQLSVGLTIVKFISGYKNDSSRNNFIKWIFYWNNLISLFLALVVLILSPWLISFLHISQPVSVYLLAPIVLLFMIASTSRSILQGLLQFTKYVNILLSEMFVKLILMVILIYLGYAFLGTMIALFLGVGVSAVLAIIYLKKYLKGKRQEKPNIVPLLKYSSATFIQGLALTSMYSVDLILVKHFFPAEQAGLYAALSVLGRIIFFGTSPVTQVMFPYVSKKYSAGEPYLNVFCLSLGLVLAASLMIILLFLFLPNLAILTLYGAEYLAGAKYLWWFGLYMSLLGIAMLFTQFYLSLNKTKIVGLFVLAALLQIILIWFNHNSILEVIYMSIIAALFLLLGLFIYFPFRNYSHKNI